LLLRVEFSGPFVHTTNQYFTASIGLILFNFMLRFTVATTYPIMIVQSHIIIYTINVFIFCVCELNASDATSSPLCIVHALCCGGCCSRWEIMVEYTQAACIARCIIYLCFIHPWSPLEGCPRKECRGCPRRIIIGTQSRTLKIPYVCGYGELVGFHIELANVPPMGRSKI
jgi:hypothetical protein